MEYSELPEFENKAVIVEQEDDTEEEMEPSERDKALVAWVLDHIERWRTYRNQNYMDEWERYERIFRGQWKNEDKHRQSERSRVISPATQQAVETRHAEIMEAVFGQGEFFDIKDDLADKNGAIDVEKLKAQLNEDFSQDRIKKSIEQVLLMGEIYGTHIAEIVVSKKKEYVPSEMQVAPMQTAYGVKEQERVCVKLNPVNPKNFLFDPNGTHLDDCMGVAIERYISIHKVANNIKSGAYRNVDISSFFKDEENEATQESNVFQDERVLQLTYYGLVPSYLLSTDGEDEDFDDADDYEDMVEAVIVIGNDSVLLKAEESPYMMKDRPILVSQADTVPLRVLGRGTVEKALNMQSAIDAQMRAHLDSLALTVSPMMGVDATRMPRGAKMEVQPGKSIMTNGNPQEILFPFKFGSSSGEALQTAKEFERMLLMATGTVDSQGMVSEGSRDAGGLAPAVASIIKKYKRTLINFQEDFLIPFVKKAAYRYMQFDPERYPSVDIKFIPSAALGIMAREYEQQQLAFLLQTLGANNPLTPVLMKGIIANSSLGNRQEILAQLDQMSQQSPEQQAQAQQQAQVQSQLVAAQAAELQSKVMVNQATAQKLQVEAQIAPEKAKADIMSAISRNLPEEDAVAQKEFDRRAKMAELMLKEETINTAKEDIRSNERISTMQMMAKRNG